MTTTVEDKKTLAGRPITGEISYYGDRTVVEQKPIQDLLDVLDAAFGFPEVESIRWHQYTPYFNDGDACTFSTHAVTVRYAGDDEDGGDYDDGHHEVYAGYPGGYWDTHHYEWQTGSTAAEGKIPADPADKRFNVTLDGVDRTHDIGAALAAVETAIDSGVHETDLYKAFGDPAEVTATREGFNVEHYDHE